MIKHLHIVKVILLTVTVFIAGIFIISCGKNKDSPDTSAEVRAYMLVIDKNNVTYLKNEEELQKLHDRLCKEKADGISNAEVIKVTVNNSMNLEEGVCDPSQITSIDEAMEIYYSQGGKISFNVTVSESETKNIAFETVYQNSSSHFEGTKVTKTEGVNGSKRLTYHVTYTDDIESSRELHSEETLKKAQNKVVLVGTKKSTASTGSYAWPVKHSVYITSKYGGRTLNGKYEFHIGIDLRAAVGSGIYAADGGKVVYVGTLGTYGKLIKIQHDNGDMTYYAHLSSYNVSVGTRVYKGQLIAKSGATGNVTGPHLHFEIRKNGKTVNPVNYLPKI